MNFVVVDNKTIECIIVNTTKEQAKETQKIHDANGDLVEVKVKIQFPDQFESCMFLCRPNNLTWGSRLKLLLLGCKFKNE